MLDTIGWLGVAIALFSQWLIASRRALPTSGLYTGMTWLSFACVGAVAFEREAWSPLALSLAFSIITTWGWCRHRQP